MCLDISGNISTKWTVGAGRACVCACVMLWKTNYRECVQCVPSFFVPVEYYAHRSLAILCVYFGFGAFVDRRNLVIVMMVVVVVIILLEVFMVVERRTHSITHFLTSLLSLHSLTHSSDKLMEMNIDSFLSEID